MALRRAGKQALGMLGRADRAPAVGATLLTYHRVGGGTSDELDVTVASFAEQLVILAEGGFEVLTLDAALDRLDAGDSSASVVLTFDDGFKELHDIAFPLLAEHRLPFTVYLAAGLVGGAMAWEGSKAGSQGAPALTWDDLRAMDASGLCTVGNHTFTHAGPTAVNVTELDRCTTSITEQLGKPPTHFAWTWGVPVPALHDEVRARFRSAATGLLGRNPPDGDRWALRRVPVRATDPRSFFEAKLRGDLWPERTYGRIVRAAKTLRRRPDHG